MKLLRVSPSRRLVTVFSLVWGVAIALPLMHWWLDGASSLLASAWLSLTVIISALAIIDYYYARHLAPITLERQSRDILPLMRNVKVQLRLHHHGKPQRLILAELADEQLELSHDQIYLDTAADQFTEVEYDIRATRRGPAAIHACHCQRLSPWRFWTVLSELPTRSDFRVYPDYAAVEGYKLLASENNASHMGIKQLLRRGEGLEFHQLREYKEGDSQRQIDWKASSRKHKLISKEYQDERDQQIVIMLDSGRRMRADDKSLGHLDHAINAMVLLSHIGLKQGDAVGVMTFGAEQRWLPCGKGVSRVNHILNHVYDLQSDIDASDYIEAAMSLLKRQHKRSLVILMSNCRDEDEDDLVAAVKLLQKHHLVMLASVQEPVVNKVLQQSINDRADAMAFHGAVSYTKARRELLMKLIQQGVHIVDCAPERLAAEVSNRYLQIKRSGVL